MNRQPKVSILLAAYNSGETIFETLESIVEQDYPALQLIVCDDGSREFDAAAIERFVKGKCEDIELKILHHAHNLGTVKNLNSGLKNADGELAMILAADDCFASKSAVSQLVGMILESGSEWVIAKTALCDENLSKRGYSLPTQSVTEMIGIQDAGALYFELCNGCCLPAGGAVYRTDMLKGMGGFDESYRLVEDWPLFLKLVRRGSLPAITRDDTVLHRFGGVSRKKAGKNFNYQTDLITVLRKEVAPNIDILDEKKKAAVERLIVEKELGYRFRFDCTTPAAKLLWAAMHPAFMLRKIFRKKERIC